MASSHAPRPKREGPSRDYLRGLMRRICWSEDERSKTVAVDELYRVYHKVYEVRW